MGQAHGLDQPDAGQPQAAVERRRARGVDRRRAVERRSQCRREVGDRAIARPHHHRTPFDPAFLDMAPRELVQQTGENERGFSASRGARDGDERRRVKTLDQFIDLALPAEEEIGLGHRKRAQPGIRIQGQEFVRRHGAPAPAARKARSPDSSGSAVAWIVRARVVWKVAFSGVGGAIA